MHIFTYLKVEHHVILGQLLDVSTSHDPADRTGKHVLGSLIAIAMVISSVTGLPSMVNDI